MPTDHKIIIYCNMLFCFRFSTSLSHVSHGFLFACPVLHLPGLSGLNFLIPFFSSFPPSFFFPCLIFGTKHARHGEKAEMVPEGMREEKKGKRKKVVDGVEKR